MQASIRTAVVMSFASLACAQGTEPQFRRVVVDPVFRSEGIATVDIDRDGDRDLFVGDFWYEAPNWTPHRIRKGPDLGTGEHTYSECFCCFASACISGCVSVTCGNSWYVRVDGCRRRSVTSRRKSAASCGGAIASKVGKS